MINKNQFETILSAVQKNTKNASAFAANFLKFEPNKTYLVRLLPYYKDPSLTLFKHLSHHFRSKIDGSLINLICPNMFDMKCPIDEFRAKVYSTKNEQAIKEIAPLARSEYWWINVWVWKDPTNPENEGTVKIMRASKRLFKVIREAIDGEDASLYGPSIFDISENGFDLRIRSEASADRFPDYSVSKFVKATKAVPYDEEQLAEMEFNFLDFVQKPDPKEIERVFQKHWFGKIEEDELKEEDSKEAISPSFTKSDQLFKDISASLKGEEEEKTEVPDKELFNDNDEFENKESPKPILKESSKKSGEDRDSLEKEPDLEDFSEISDVIDDILNKVS